MKMSKSESGKLGATARNLVNAERKIERIQVYNLDPSICGFVQCAKPNLSYEKRNNKFCSQSCAASHNNSLKPKKVSSSETNVKIISVRPDRPAMVTFECCNCSKSKEQHRHRGMLFCSNNCRGEHKKKQKASEVEAGTATSGQAKRYLIAKHGNICLAPDCAWDFTKKPINVELEHVDGNASNNRLENLTLLCPNCHSTTPTYKSKNKGNGRHYRRERYKAGKSF